jgi:sulfur transfer complex TusBCD TusB component (DsrH family)
MIGIRTLSHNRQELFASRLPLDVLKPYLLADYAQAYVVLVLYEDTQEVIHESGIIRFDPTEPVTYNYERFQAPLIADYHDKLAVCTVENLFLHLERYVEDNPLADDPFHNIVFSVLEQLPSSEVLESWEKNIDTRLKRVLYDVKSSDHFQLFPEEICVVYSHNNHYTSITSDKPDLIYALFEDTLERQLAPLNSPELLPAVVQGLFQQAQYYQTIRLVADRLYQDEHKPYLLITYSSKHSSMENKLLCKLFLSEKGHPVFLDEPFYMPRWQYWLKYSDLSILPMVVMVSLVALAVLAAVYLKLLVKH